MAAVDTAQAAVRKGRAAACCAMLLACAAAPAVADYDVGAGGTTFIANGRYDLACTDLLVAGTLNLDTGTFVNVRDVIVQPGGVINGGSGVIFLSRNFTVLPGGVFNAQTSTVAYDTACGPGAVEAPIPTLGTAMLIALSGLLAALAMVFAGGGATQRRRQIPEEPR